MRKPYKYQEDPITQGINAKAHMIEADCGTGKSLMAAQIALGKGLPTLIITPKNIVDDFKSELLADGVAEEDIWVYDSENRRKDEDAYLAQFIQWLKGGYEIG